MKISYKFNHITKADDIHISEVGVRFYEGDTVLVQSLSGEEVPQYKLMRRLGVEDIESEREVRFDIYNQPYFIYTDKDFGVTTDVDDIRIFLNKVIAKDKNRTPEDTQKAITKTELLSQTLK